MTIHFFTNLILSIMRKLKLLIAACALIFCGVTANAREDVTSTYLTGANLANESADWGLEMATSNNGNHNWNDTYKYHESWHNSFSLSQTATVPNGYYQISIQAVNSVIPSSNAKLTATSGDNTASAYIRHSSAGNFGEISEWLSGNPLACRIYATVKVDNGSLTVGFSQTNKSEWIVYGQFKLYSLTEEEYNNAIILQNAIESNTNGWSNDWTNGGNQYRFGRERFNDAAYEKGKIIYKSFSVPKGKYDVTVMARTNVAWREAATGDNIAEVYANDGKYSLTVNAETGFTPTSDYNYTLSNILASDGNIEVGIRNIGTGGNWYVISLVNLLLTEPYISYTANEIPAATATALTADAWYKFIPASSDNYTFDATTVGDIIYTTTDQLPSTATGTTADATVALTAGTTYYIKSSTAQSLKISPQTFTYTVGEATASLTIIQPGKTITITYESLESDDPNANFTQNLSGVTLNGSSITCTATSNGFTFVVPNTVTAATDYVLSIPANAIGYSNGDGTYNAQQDIILKTPSVFDGTYYLYNPTTKRFLARGNSYGTAALVDFYGVPFTLTVDNEGYAKLVFLDNKQGLFNGGGTDVWCWTDNAATSYEFVIVEGGYNIKTKGGEADKYIHVSAADDYRVGHQGDATLWQLKTPTERNEVLVAYTTDNYQNIITAANLGTTTDAFETYLTTNYAGKDYTDKVGTARITNAADDWTWTGVRGQDNQPAYNNAAEAWNATGSWTQTIDNLPEGIYRVKINAFERRMNNADSYALGEAGYGNVTSSYLKANDEQVRLKSWYEEVEKNGDSYNPNTMGQAVTAFNNDKYKSEVYTYVGSDGKLTLTIAKPNYIWDCWLLWNNVTLTYFTDQVDEAEVTALLETAAEYLEKPMLATLKQYISDAKDALESNSSIANFNALQTAIDNSQTSVDSYAAMKANYLDPLADVLENTNVYTTAAYNSVYGDYLTAYNNGTIANADANALNWKEGDKGTRPVDNLLMPSWTIGGETTGNKFYQNTWSNEGASDGTDFLLPFYEYWVSGDNVLEATTLQTTQAGLIPGGFYEVSAWVRVQESNAGEKIANGITMQVGEGDAVDVTAGTQIEDSKRYIGEYKAIGQADASGNLIIKFNVADGSNISWLAFKNLNCQEASVYQIIGLCNDWTSGHMMTQSTENEKVYTFTTEVNVFGNEEAKYFEYKLRKGNEWGEEVYQLPAQGSNPENKSWSATEGNGIYTLTFTANVENHTLDCVAEKADDFTFAVVGCKADGTEAGTTNEIFSSTWNTATTTEVMTKNADGTYFFEKEAELEAQTINLKVVAQGLDGKVRWYGNGEANVSVEIASAGTYYFTVNFDGSNVTASALAKQTYTLAGIEDVFGSDWDPTDADNDMTRLTDGSGNYTKTYENVVLAANTTIKYKVVENHAWTTNWGMPDKTEGNGEYRVENAGTYHITFTFNPTTAIDGTYHVMCSVIPATVTKTITDAGYATYCSPYALDFSESGLTAYIAEMNGAEVSFTPVTSVPANTGVLLKGSKGDYTIKTAFSSDTNVDANKFIGTVTGTTAPVGSFVLLKGDKGVGFYKTTAEFTIGANTAYLPALTTTARFIGFDESTGVESIAAEKQMNNEIYNLQGQRINTAKKGLYIINGKKVFVK